MVFRIVKTSFAFISVNVDTGLEKFEISCSSSLDIIQADSVHIGFQDDPFLLICLSRKTLV